MLIALATNAAAGKLIPFVLCSIGAVALFYVHRRRLQRLSRSDRESAQSLRVRSSDAHRAIDQIALRDWMRRHKSALRFKRGSRTAQEQAFAALAGVNARQRQVAR